MGEHPALSERDIKAIAEQLQQIGTERRMTTAILNVEHLVT